MTGGFARAAGGDRCVVGHALSQSVDQVRRYPAECVSPPARMDGIPRIKAGFPGARSG